jgi:hypothetical protein
MKVVRHDRIADQVDTEERGKLAEVIFDPRFSVVEILPRNGIIPHEETTPDGAIEDVSDRDFVGVKDFGT